MTNYKDILDKISQEIGIELQCSMLTETVDGKVKIYACTKNHRISKSIINRINNYNGKTLLSDEILKRDYLKIEEGEFSTYFTVPNEEEALIIAYEKAWLIGEGFVINRAHYFVFPAGNGVLFLFTEKNEEDARYIRQHQRAIAEVLTTEF